MIDFSCGHLLSETLSVVGTVKPMIVLIVTIEAKNTRIQSSHWKLLQMLSALRSFARGIRFTFDTYFNWFDLKIKWKKNTTLLFFTTQKSISLKTEYIRKEWEKKNNNIQSANKQIEYFIRFETWRSWWWWCWCCCC